MDEFTIDSVFSDDIQLLQPKKGYRFGIDAVLLAHFLKVSPEDELLEIGAGNGVILVLLSHLAKFRRATAVEIQHELADLCRKNFAANGLNHVTVLETNVRDLEAYLAPHSFDHLFSNPPYRKAGAGKLNPIQQKAVARHEIHMNLEDLFLCATAFLKTAGKLSLVLPSFREQDLRHLAKQYEFHFREIQYVYSTKDQPYVLFLCTLSQERQECHEKPPFILYDIPGKYSAQANRILKKRQHPPAGLCESCKHVKIVESERGSRFVMCLLSKTDPSFRKYPPLPVHSCRGYVQKAPAD